MHNDFHFSENQLMQMFPTLPTILPHVQLVIIFLLCCLLHTGCLRFHISVRIVLNYLMISRNLFMYYLMSPYLSMTFKVMENSCLVICHLGINFQGTHFFCKISSCILLSCASASIHCMVSYLHLKEYIFCYTGW
jgi:hypothetical protein